MGSRHDTKPHAFGHYVRQDTDIYFFLSEFVEMEEVMPDPAQLCANLARLHSESKSPNGQFGFYVTTC